jgi:hypothetical protein
MAPPTTPQSNSGLSISVELQRAVYCLPLARLQRVPGAEESSSPMSPLPAAMGQQEAQDRQKEVGALEAVGQRHPQQQLEHSRMGVSRRSVDQRSLPPGAPMVVVVGSLPESGKD